MGRKNKKLEGLQRTLQVLDGGKKDDGSRDIITHRTAKQEHRVKDNRPPECPEYLKKRFAMENIFKMFLSLINDAGMKAYRCDSMAIGRMSTLHMQILKCERFIQQNGETYWNESIQGGLQQKKHQEVGILQNAEKELRQYFREFGLTPRARQNMKLNPGGSSMADDPAGRLGG